MKNSVKVIAWALAGVHYTFTRPGCGNCSCTTYLNANTFLEKFLSGEYQKDRPDDDFRNAWVLNQEKLVQEKVYLVMSSPVLDVTIHPFSVNKFVAQTTLNLDKYSTEIENLRPLDSVGVEIYVEWWRRQGAIIGRVEEDNKSIKWD